MKDAPVRIWARPDYNECWLKKGEEEDELYHHDDKVQALVDALVQISNAPSEMTWGEDSEISAALTKCERIADTALAQFNPTPQPPKCIHMTAEMARNCRTCNPTQRKHHET